MVSSESEGRNGFLSEEREQRVSEVRGQNARGRLRPAPRNESPLCLYVWILVFGHWDEAALHQGLRHITGLLDDGL